LQSIKFPISGCEIKKLGSRKRKMITSISFFVGANSILGYK